MKKQPTHATFGFVQTFNRILKDFDPANIAIV